MISLLNRQRCMEFIHESVATGAALNRTRSVLEVHQKTYQRWIKKGTVQEDGRPGAKLPSPSNKLTIEERELSVTISNEDQYKDLPPSKIVSDWLTKVLTSRLNPVLIG